MEFPAAMASTLAWAFNAMGIELEPDVAEYSKPADELVRALADTAQPSKPTTDI